jgi:Galactose oxidase, central domain/Kelch motif
MKNNLRNFFVLCGIITMPLAQVTPGSRNSHMFVQVDNSSLYIFAGYGCPAPGYSWGDLNDLWKFDITTNKFAYLKGTPFDRQYGSYGTINVPNSSNQPGTRENSFFTALNGNIYLYGGLGLTTSGTNGYLNDMWRFNPSDLMWTWISGSATINPPASYSPLGTYGTSYTPGARAAGGLAPNSAGTELIFFLGSRAFNSYVGDVWNFRLSDRTCRIVIG